MRGSALLLDLFKRQRRGACTAWHATSRRRRGPLITLQTVLHYSAGYSSRSTEFFGFKSRKTLLQFKIVL
jgi:hypothetical protein